MDAVSVYDLKHFKREEETKIQEYLSNKLKIKHISLFGTSGVGKSEIVYQMLNYLHSKEDYKNFPIIHVDCAMLGDDVTKKTLLNYISYKTLKKHEPNSNDYTFIQSKKCFLTYLKSADYKEDIKQNVKKTIVTSLALLSNIGHTASEILNFDNTKMIDNFQNTEYVIEDYIVNSLSKKGIVFFLDNIHHLSNDVVHSLFDIFQSISGPTSILFTAYTIKTNKEITHELLKQQCIYNESLSLIIENVKIEDFIEICKENLDSDVYRNVYHNINDLYNLTQCGNMKEIDELIFQVKANGVKYINEIPTLLAIQALDEAKKDIIDLVSIFPEGVRINIIKRIVSYNNGCSEKQIEQSISKLQKTKFLLEGDNSTLKLKHDKYAEASSKNIETGLEEERFINLINSCKKILNDILYEDISDSDFVFCINALSEFKVQFNLIYHLGVLEKYLDILYTNFKYDQICKFYKGFIDSANTAQVAMLLPFKSIIQILDSHQKTSKFVEGIEIIKELDDYYNIDFYKSKFLLQSYRYEDAIAIIENKLCNYESWSIYLNALQHKREDDLVKEKVKYLISMENKYDDVEYYYVILRNTGHLFDFDTSINNLNQALSYFKVNGNEYAIATCQNNIGIVYLYSYKEDGYVSKAETYFKQAIKKMKELNSKEEYQPLMNIGLCFLLKNNFELANIYFEESLKTIPKNLSFDILKVKVNIAICQLNLKQLKSDDFIKTLSEYYLEADNLPDPWIKLLCYYNIQIIRKKQIINLKDLPFLYPGRINVYGIFYKKFMLGVSPHWRY